MYEQKGKKYIQGRWFYHSTDPSFRATQFQRISQYSERSDDESDIREFVEEDYDEEDDIEKFGGRENWKIKGGWYFHPLEIFISNQYGRYPVLALMGKLNVHFHSLAPAEEEGGLDKQVILSDTYAHVERESWQWRFKLTEHFFCSKLYNYKTGNLHLITTSFIDTYLLIKPRPPLLLNEVSASASTLSEVEDESQKKLVVLDVFSGCGGLSLGLEQAGMEVRWAVDLAPSALATMASSHPHAKVSYIHTEEA